MANYRIADPVVGAPLPVTQTGTWASYNSTTQGVAPPYPWGLQVRAFDRKSNTEAGSGGVGAGVFQFVCGSNVGAGEVCYIVGNTVKQLTAAPGISSAYPLAVAAGALSATSVYGWVQVQGIADYVACTNHSFAAGVALWPGSTAGYVGSVSSAGGRIYGMVPPVSNHSSLSAGSMTFQLQYPFILGITGSI